MSKSKHTESQIIAALKQAEACRTAEDVAREYAAFCEGHFYQSDSKSDHHFCEPQAPMRFFQRVKAGYKEKFKTSRRAPDAFEKKAVRAISFRIQKRIPVD